MKFIHSPRFLLTCFFVLNISCLQAQTKHALIFAIGSYKHWPTISSKNDVPYIQSVLLKQEFPANNITVVMDSAATRQGIENAFKTLVSRVQPGDIVVIHFSSHGEQVEDNNNKDETDGLDESIVTYNALYPISSENFSTDQGNYFRDDQFGVYIDQLRTRLGKKGDVVVFIDACHSGSGTRGSRKVRGGAPPLVSKNFKAKNIATVNTADVFLEGKTTRGEPVNLATYVVISAARADELNQEADNEGKSMGSLTYAISKVFENLSPGTTYRSLFSGILSVMNETVPQQHPVIEGTGLDRVLFDSNFVVQKPFIEIEEINGNTLILKEGLMSGLDSGAKVALYASGTNDPGKAIPLASGIISSAEPFKASVTLDKDPGITAAKGWVFITEPVYKTKPLVILVGSATRGGTAGNFSETEVSAIKNALKEIPVVRLEGSPELLLVKGTGADSLKIAANGYVFSTIKSTGELKEQIRRYTQYKFLQKLVLNDPSCKLDVKLVPYVNGKADKSTINKKMVNGINEFNVNDSLLIWVKNNGDKTVYFNILDIQPDGIINPILPNTAIRPKIYPQDLKVDPGQEILFDKYKITIAPPLGMENFKVFVSEKEINMESIATSAGTKSRGDFSVLEQLVNNSYSMATRGGKVENTGKSEGSTFNLLFRIKRPK
jgi:hypothetical protein